jgi:hypothetical protein
MEGAKTTTEVLLTSTKIAKNLLPYGKQAFCWCLMAGWTRFCALQSLLGLLRSPPLLSGQPPAPPHGCSLIGRFQRGSLQIPSLL